MKHKGPMPDLKKERYWRDILRQYRRSGLNIREFCRSRNLSEPSFYAWRREIKRRDQSSVTARPRTAKAARTKRSLPQRSMPIAATFLPVRLSAEIASMPASGVECLLPSGAVLRMPPGMEAVAIAAVVRAWEQGRC
jgi:hypothetical protein